MPLFSGCIYVLGIYALSVDWQLLLAQNIWAVICVGQICFMFGLEKPIYCYLILYVFELQGIMLVLIF
ncbi:hypothetical protein BGI33_11315 [Snodgrassella alvi]|uniref:Uncharacterized protein n=1 Tax=Snodgrassella alvi TaxID=1196083 RepID=A0A2N9WVR2_9NEIS|nr:hypothetical protein BGI33_11315 [Snodgrassella alvi]PIT17473.1 hypothetical protein BGI32_02495 [Snodgrassella alvi]PIT18763.1 hypothetical protein BGI34_04290 [Snodgrassella alvi]